MSAAAGARQFHPGIELGTEDALEVTRARYGHVIGVLGSTGAGKTCFLLSLYLMASQDALPSDFGFSGSLTLQGFEDRARRLRAWSGGPLPDQLADHTVLSDPRRPAFMHLGLRERTGNRRRLDLMLTDLPGEWTANLIDRADAAGRFSFLQRADGLVLVVDGPALESTSRHVELQRMKHVVERLATDVRVDLSTPFVLLVSKCDEIRMRIPPTVDELHAYATSLGFATKVIPTAAFSRTPNETPNGKGVFDVIEEIVRAPDCGRPVAGPAHMPEPRAFLRFRHRGT